MCKFNSQKANYKVSTSEEKEEHIQTNKKEVNYSIWKIIKNNNNNNSITLLFSYVKT
jgi:hypothetical protein